MKKILLAGDIGGTKTILQLVQAGAPQSGSLRDRPTDYRVLYQDSFASQEYPDLVPIVQAFLQQAQKTIEPFNFPLVACFGIAGPVVDNACELTNLHWQLSGDRLGAELNLAKVSLINDFAAVGYGILGLTATDLHTIQTGVVNAQAPIALIGAGTGLGQGFVIPQGDSYQVFNSEGGHSDFAPRNQEEFQLLTWIKNNQQLTRISTERVVSGLGIVNIYQYLRHQYPDQESPALAEIYQQWLREQQNGETAISQSSAVRHDLGAIIGKKASQKEDQLCERTIAMFISLYGAEAGNLALKLLPYGGLYIAGGIAPKILPLFDRYHFLSSFLDKGRMAPSWKKFPLPSSPIPTLA